MIRVNDTSSEKIVVVNPRHIVRIDFVKSPLDGIEKPWSLVIYLAANNGGRDVVLSYTTKEEALKTLEAIEHVVNYSNTGETGDVDQGD